MHTRLYRVLYKKKSRGSKNFRSKVDNETGCLTTVLVSCRAILVWVFFGLSRRIRTTRLTTLLEALNQASVLTGFRVFFFLSPTDQAQTGKTGDCVAKTLPLAERLVPWNGQGRTLMELTEGFYSGKDSHGLPG